MAKIKKKIKMTIVNAYEDEQQKHSCIADRNVKLQNHFGRELGSFLER